MQLVCTYIRTFYYEFSHFRTCILIGTHECTLCIYVSVHVKHNDTG